MIPPHLSKHLHFNFYHRPATAAKKQIRIQLCSFSTSKPISSFTASNLKSAYQKVLNTTQSELLKRKKTLLITKEQSKVIELNKQIDDLSRLFSKLKQEDLSQLTYTETHYLEHIITQLKYIGGSCTDNQITLRSVEALLKQCTDLRSQIHNIQLHSTSSPASTLVNALSAQFLDNINDVENGLAVYKAELTGKDSCGNTADYYFNTDY